MCACKLFVPVQRNVQQLFGPTGIRVDEKQMWYNSLFNWFVSISFDGFINENIMTGSFFF